MRAEKVIEYKDGSDNNYTWSLLKNRGEPGRKTGDLSKNRESPDHNRPVISYNT